MRGGEGKEWEERGGEGRGEDRQDEERPKPERKLPDEAIFSWDSTVCGMCAERARRQVKSPRAISQCPPPPPTFLSWTSDAYLTHTVDGTSEAVIGNGCVPGFDWPQGLAVRGGEGGRLETPGPLHARSALRCSLAGSRAGHGTKSALRKPRREVCGLGPSPGDTGRTPPT